MKNEGVASLLVVALIAGVAFGAVFFPRTLTLTSTQTTTLVSTITVPTPFVNMTVPQCTDSTSLPCGFISGTQDILVITNASLTVSPSTNLNNSRNGVLSLTLVHSGAYEGTTLAVYLERLGGTNYIEVLQTTAVGQSGTYPLSIPRSFALTSGSKYEVIVDSASIASGNSTGAGGEAVEELRIVLTAN